MDTIYAVSSGAPPAAIAVLRISGPDASAACTILAGSLPTPRHAALRTLRDPANGCVLDRALVLVFPAPGSATGEDLIELHLHGGRAVVRAVENALAALPTLRPAEAGEFTRRALENGRIDLTEAEGIGDLLGAETESQRRAAIMAADGGIRRRIDDWAGRTLALSARVEAELDFSDEDDVDPADIAAIVAEAILIANEIDVVVARPPVERLRDGIRVVLAGPPNSGKSTLLNALVDRDAAIVSPIAGTTRDRIDAPISRDGIAYVFTDTAGIADVTDDVIEQIGIDRARSAMLTADIVLWLGDDDAPDRALRVHPRADMLGREQAQSPAIVVSAVSGLGLSELWDAIQEEAARMLPRMDDIVLNHRQRVLASDAAKSLQSAGIGDALIVAEALRHTLALFDRITGRADTEAMLDALFGNFCIGK